MGQRQKIQEELESEEGYLGLRHWARPSCAWRDVSQEEGGALEERRFSLLSHTLPQILPSPSALLMGINPEFVLEEPRLGSEASGRNKEYQ